MSKIARQITALLLAHECLHMTRGNKAREIIDRILAPRTIKKSELDALRTDAANMAEAQAAYNYADSEATRWHNKFREQSTMIVELQAKAEMVKSLPLMLDILKNPEFVKQIDMQALRTMFSDVTGWKFDGPIFVDARDEKIKTLETKLSAAEAELNQYRQAEEVETKLDEFAKGEEVLSPGTYIKTCTGPIVSSTITVSDPDNITWTWSGEPTRVCPHTEQPAIIIEDELDKIVAHMPETPNTGWWRKDDRSDGRRVYELIAESEVGKLPATPLPAEVEPETCPVTEQPVESPSKWRDFLSCIGFKN